MKRNNIFIIVCMMVLVTIALLVWRSRILDGSSKISSNVSVKYFSGQNILQAEFDNVNKTVAFNYPDIGMITLPVAISASGARYANKDESVVFWEHQGEATLFKNGKEVFRGRIELLNQKMTEADARVIAEKTCIKGGGALSAGSYNEITKTWWFDANLNAEHKGCNPACVVSEETKTAEINWRCTGLKR